MPGTGWKEIYIGGSPEAEKKLFDEVITKVQEIQGAVAARQRAAIRRGFHNKGTPVRVAFRTADDLPDYLQVGFLHPGAEYEGFGRFSRSQSMCRADRSLDQRGFAFRILTDDGPQDFLLSNTPVSFAEDPVTFLKGGEIFVKSNKVTTPIRLIRTFGLKKGLRIVKDIVGSPDRTLSFTCQQYWTRVPFQIGPAAVSFTVVPVPDEPAKVSAKGPDFLTEHLKEQLRQGPRTFTLYAQFFVSEEKTPIENSNREWKEADAPLVRIGEVVIPQQDLDAQEARALAERIEGTDAFSPWNTKHLQPLGGMNRARKEAYDRSAQSRGGCPLQRTQ